MFSGYWGSFLALKQLGCEINHSCAETKHECSYISACCTCLYCVDRDSFTFQCELLTAPFNHKLIKYTFYVACLLSDLVHFPDLRTYSFLCFCILYINFISTVYNRFASLLQQVSISTTVIWYVV